VEKENYGWRKANVLSTIYYDKITLKTNRTQIIETRLCFGGFFKIIIRFAMDTYLG
jgi:hypothetical protein